MSGNETDPCHMGRSPLSAEKKSEIDKPDERDNTTETSEIPESGDTVKTVVKGKSNVISEAGK